MVVNGSQNTKRAVRKPFWLPASSYYFLVAGTAVASFFLVILIFNDGGKEVEWISAGLVASGILVVGVFVREVVLRSVRDRHINRRNILDRNLRIAAMQSGEFNVSNKFTLEKNEAALNAIRTKSDAAKIFGRISAGHREVFDLCVEYRRIVKEELPLIHPNSPRLEPLMRGNRLAAGIQKFHLLKWAEIEARDMAEKASASFNLDDKEKFANSALDVIEFAAAFYPDEPKLNASRNFILEFNTGAKIDQLIKDGDAAVAGRKFEDAERLYSEAIDLLAGDISKYADSDTLESVEKKLYELRNIPI